MPSMLSIHSSHQSFLPYMAHFKPSWKTVISQQSVTLQYLGILFEQALCQDSSKACRANSDTQLAARTNSPVVGSLRDGDGKRQKATYASLLQSRSYILLQGIDYLMSAQPMTYGTQRTVAEMQRCRCKAQHQVCSAQHSIRGRPRWRP